MLYNRLLGAFKLGAVSIKSGSTYRIGTKVPQVFGKDIMVVIMLDNSTFHVPDLVTVKYTAVTKRTMKIYRLSDAFLDQFRINNADRFFAAFIKNARIELCAYEGFEIISRDPYVK
jgi:hypothetical protein